MVVTADQNLVRKHNTAIVLNVLRHRAPLSRAELAAYTGLNRSTVSSIVNGLVADHLVQETTLQSDRVGRPGMLLELNPNGGFAIGIEIGVDFISIIVADFVANVLWRDRVDTDPSDGEKTILDRAYDLTQTALEFGRSRGLTPLGVGLGLPGIVDLEHGQLMLAPNLGWKNTPLAEMWTQRFDLPVFVENDGNAAALGEYYFGAARGHNTFIYLSAGVGLGAGIVLDGKLYRGSQGYAAEIGHMTIDPKGELCGCGKRGCLETVTGPRAVVRSVHQALDRGRPSLLRSDRPASEVITFDMIVEASRQGDQVARQALIQAGRMLGLGVANLVNIFNPEMIVLGGILNIANDLLLPVIQETVLANALDISCQALQITASSHGTEACVIGAVALVLENIHSAPRF